jgi:hypothetical protein
MFRAGVDFDMKNSVSVDSKRHTKKERKHCEPLCTYQKRITMATEILKTKRAYPIYK